MKCRVAEMIRNLINRLRSDFTDSFSSIETGSREIHNSFFNRKNALDQKSLDADWQIRRHEVAQLAVQCDKDSFNKLVNLVHYPNLAVSIDAVEALLSGWRKDGLEAVLIAALEEDEQTHGWIWDLLHEQTDYGPGQIENWLNELELLDNDRVNQAIDAYRRHPW